MKHYKAIITGGTLAPQAVILEQDREAYAAVFMENAMQQAFMCVCEDGIEAERNPYTINFYVNDTIFATIDIKVWQNTYHDESIWADYVLTTKPRSLSMIVRRMNIAE